MRPLGVLRYETEAHEGPTRIATQVTGQLSSGITCRSNNFENIFILPLSPGPQIYLYYTLPQTPRTTLHLHLHSTLAWPKSNPIGSGFRRVSTRLTGHNLGVSRTISESQNAALRLFQNERYLIDGQRRFFISVFPFNCGSFGKDSACSAESPIANVCSLLRIRT